jgi:hypothetical protein
MKTDLTFDSESLSDNMVLAVTLIATIYWVLGPNKSWMNLRNCGARWWKPPRTLLPP